MQKIRKISSYNLIFIATAHTHRHTQTHTLMYITRQLTYHSYQYIKYSTSCAALLLKFLFSSLSLLKMFRSLILLWKVNRKRIKFWWKFHLHICTIATDVMPGFTNGITHTLQHSHRIFIFATASQLAFLHKYILTNLILFTVTLGTKALYA
jgi:hypothetical protein